MGQKDTDCRKLYTQFGSTHPQPQKKNSKPPGLYFLRLEDPNLATISIRGNFGHQVAPVKTESKAQVEQMVKST